MTTMTVMDVQAGKSDFLGRDAIIAMQELTTNPNFKSTSPKDIAILAGGFQFTSANIGETKSYTTAAGNLINNQGHGKS